MSDAVGTAPNLMLPMIRRSVKTLRTCGVPWFSNRLASDIFSDSSTVPKLFYGVFEKYKNSQSSQVESPTCDTLGFYKRYSRDRCLAALDFWRQPPRHRAKGSFRSAPRYAETRAELGEVALGTVTASPVLHEVNPSAVAVGAVATGLGLFGSTAAYGSFGTAHIIASATSSFSVPDGFSLHRAYLDRCDRICRRVYGWSVSASNVRLDLVSERQLFGRMQQALLISLLKTKPRTNLFLRTRRLFAYRLSSSSSKTTDVMLSAGNTYLFNWSMEADASAGVDQLNLFWRHRLYG